MALWVRFLVAGGFLLFVRFSIRPWLGVGPRDPFSGSMLAAFAVVFAALAGYRVWLGDLERRALAEALSLAKRLPEDGQREGRWATLLPGVFEQLGLATLGIGLVLVTLYAPQEATMKMLQRIFYVHVPCAWIAFLAFLVVAVASIVYLIKRKLSADRVAASSAEIGIVFTSLVLITGPIWAKPAWGIWWTWDARLTTTLFLWLIYVGYLTMRAQVADPHRRATIGAVLGILGAVVVYVDYKAITWWRTQHPAPVMGGGADSGLDPMMGRAFAVMLLAFTLGYLAMLLGRIRIARLEEENDERHRRLSFAAGDR